MASACLVRSSACVDSSSSRGWKGKRSDVHRTRSTEATQVLQ